MDEEKIFKILDYLAAHPEFIVKAIKTSEDRYKYIISAEKDNFHFSIHINKYCFYVQVIFSNGTEISLDIDGDQNRDTLYKSVEKIFEVIREYSINELELIYNEHTSSNTYNN